MAFDFNPRPSREERQQIRRKRSLLEHFNPRPSREERLDSGRSELSRAEISIHAPLARSDQHGRRHLSLRGNFNPRPSREERPSARLIVPDSSLFQSTPLSRGATAKSYKTIARFSSFYIKTSDLFCFCTFAGTKKFSKQVLSGCEPSNKR